MPRKGYSQITLKDDDVKVIDKLVDKDNKEMNSRSKVVVHCIKKVVSHAH